MAIHGFTGLYDDLSLISVNDKEFIYVERKSARESEVVVSGCEGAQGTVMTDDNSADVQQPMSVRDQRKDKPTCQLFLSSVHWKCPKCQCQSACLDFQTLTVHCPMKQKAARPTATVLATKS